MEKKLSFALEIKPLLTPNYILCGDDMHPVSIAEFTDEELIEIVERYKADILEKARKRRKTLT